MSSATRIKFPASTSRVNNTSKFPRIADLLIGRLVRSTADPINLVDIVVVGSIVVTPVIAVESRKKHKVTSATMGRGRGRGIELKLKMFY